jgi:hypothetical protein
MRLKQKKVSASECSSHSGEFWSSERVREVERVRRKESYLRRHNKASQPTHSFPNKGGQSREVKGCTDGQETYLNIFDARVELGIEEENVLKTGLALSLLL